MNVIMKIINKNKFYKILKIVIILTIAINH